MNLDEIKVIWQKRKASILLDTKRIEEVDAGWKCYKNKIINETLTLENYANRVDRADMKALHGGYLCNFLERTSSSIYGSSKPGTAFGFGIVASEKDGQYNLMDEGRKVENCDRTKVETQFNKIKSQIKSLVDVSSAEECTNKIPDTGNTPITGTQILGKICVLNFPDKFLAIYAIETIDQLYKIFLPDQDDNLSNLSKNLKLATYLFRELEVEKVIDKLKLAIFLYELVSAQSVFDKNNLNVIFYGPPGTGKTYSIRKALELLQASGKAIVEFVQFHPSFTYEDFIEGVKPRGITSAGQIDFAMTNGVFKQFCIEAKKQPNKQFYFVIDEINRANLSSVFGELLYCLEYRYPNNGSKEEQAAALVTTQYSSLIGSLKENSDLAFEMVGDKVKFGIPDNVHVIGTMNDVDKSVDSFDLALRRRFKWIKTECDYKVIRTELASYFDEDVDMYIAKCEALNAYISSDKNNGLNLGSSYEFGHYHFLRIKEILTSKKHISAAILKDIFEHYLQPTLKEYLRGEYSEPEIEGKSGKLAQAKEKFVGKPDNNDQY